MNSPNKSQRDLLQAALSGIKLRFILCTFVYSGASRIPSTERPFLKTSLVVISRKNSFCM